MPTLEDADARAGLVAIDADLPGATVPHCARCNDPLAPGWVYPEPGPFCEACVTDMLAAAKSYGGPAGDFANRYNRKLTHFAAFAHQVEAGRPSRSPTRWSQRRRGQARS